jgi:hypothetical protein
MNLLRRCTPQGGVKRNIIEPITCRTRLDIAPALPVGAGKGAFPSMAAG